MAASQISKWPPDFRFRLFKGEPLLGLTWNLQGALGAGREKFLWKNDPIWYSRWPPAEIQNGRLIFLLLIYRRTIASFDLKFTGSIKGRVEEGSLRKSAWSDIQDGRQPIFKMAAWFSFRSFKGEPLRGLTWNLQGALRVGRGRFLSKICPIQYSRYPHFREQFTRCIALCVLPN